MTHGPNWWTTYARRAGWPKAGAAPLAATQRNPALYTEGPQVAVVARHLGTPFLPWQAYAADVIGERRPDGEYEHQVVVVSVPRQSGKTTLLRAIGTHRALVEGRDVFYTAQTGKDARARWGDLVTALETSPLKRRVTVRRAAGQERVIFPGGAAFQAFAPTAESLHGYTPPLVMLDEAFAHDERTGDLLMGAIGPAQITIVDRQILIVSTMGTADSVFLARWVAKAIEGTPRVAVLLWAATDDQDPFDPATIEAIHPAVGFRINGKLLTAAHVLAEAETNTRAEYERAYLNRATLTTSHTIPSELWRPLALADDVVARPPLDRIVLSYDVAADGVAASIVATWRHAGRPHSKVVMSAPGQAWLAGQVVELVERWRPLAVAAHDANPTRTVTDQVERAGVDVVKVSPADWVTASGAMLDRIRSAQFTHDGSSRLESAFAGVGVRVLGDSQVFSRRLSVGDTSPAFAVTAGTWVLDRAPRPRPKPVLVVRS